MRIVDCKQGRHVARAFTLIELIVVLTLLVLLAMLAWPAVSSLMTSSELPESASRLRSTLYMARSGAISEHRRVRVRFEEKSSQPIVEIERDPFTSPGNFETITAAWTQEPVVLGDVQVYSVTLGRPEFMKPVSEDIGPGQGGNETATDAPEETADEGAKTEETLALRTAIETKEDPNRPTIMFEPDGSTDWAWLTVARQMPGEGLPKDAEQRWVIVDGRTGMITIRDALSEEELADPDLCVARAKLELPDIGRDLTETGLQVGNPLAGMTPPPDSGSQQENGLEQGLEQTAEQLGDMGKTLADGQKPDETGTAGTGQTAEGTGHQGKKARSGAMQDPTQAQSTNPADTLQGLQDRIDQSNLTEEQKKQMKQSAEGGGKGR